jgi:hypothetical protein
MHWRYFCYLELLEHLTLPFDLLGASVLATRVAWEPLDVCTPPFGHLADGLAVRRVLGLFEVRVLPLGPSEVAVPMTSRAFGRPRTVAMERAKAAHSCVML